LGSDSSDEINIRAMGIKGISITNFSVQSVNMEGVLDQKK
jgi:hypothetical protein